MSKHKKEIKTLKYKINYEDKIYAPFTVLYRIQALKDFGDVKKGDLGGYVENNNNLSQTGECWAYHNTRIYGNARLQDNAKLKNSARIYDNVIVQNNAKLLGCATARGAAKISNNVQIYGHARVNENENINGNFFFYANVDELDNKWEDDEDPEEYKI